MIHPIEVPRPDHLAGLPVDAVPGRDPGVCSVTARAGEGDDATVIWNELAGPAPARWQSCGVVRLDARRSRRSPSATLGERVEFHVWFRIDGLGGELVVDIGQRVMVTDALLRT